MKDTLFFSVSGSNSIHELQLGLTLIGFSEFDLAYFREQCLGIYRNNRPEDFMEKAPNLKEYLHRCHPWCKALLSSVFNTVVLDCVIDDICAVDGVGLEELWTRNMNAEDRFGQALFRRVSDYKFGRAINQWLNLQRMQAYALAKMTFIYGGVEADLQTHKARKLYYDLTFSLTAEAMGFSSSDMPAAEAVSIPYLPQAGTIMPTAAGIVGPAVRALTEGVPVRTPRRGEACVRDQMAGLVINVMSGLTPPKNEDIAVLNRKYGTIPNVVFQPAGFKAILDLEFDQMIERGLYIKIDGANRSCRRYGDRTEVMPSEKENEAVLEQAPPAEKTASAKEASPAQKTTSHEKAAPAKGTPPAEKTVQKEKQVRRGAKGPEARNPAEVSARAELKPVAPHAETKADKESITSGKIRSIVEMAEDPRRRPSGDRTLQEVNTRCNLIWTSMNVRSGWSITAEDASEWFRYLTRLRYGIGKGELKPVALDKFLDATLEVYKLLPENV